MAGGKKGKYGAIGLRERRGIGWGERKREEEQLDWGRERRGDCLEEKEGNMGVLVWWTKEGRSGGEREKECPLLASFLWVPARLS